MHGILSELGRLFVGAIPTILLLYLLLYILERVLFRPLNRALRAREEATSGVLSEARKLTAEAEEKQLNYEHSIRSARLESYRQREAARQQSLAERQEMLRQSRAHAEGSLKVAHSELSAEVVKLKGELKSVLDRLTEQVVATILNPRDAGGSAEERRP
jgi:F-type H+-transporting ATPase subunit b